MDEGGLYLDKRQSNYLLVVRLRGVLFLLTIFYSQTNMDPLIVWHKIIRRTSKIPPKVACKSLPYLKRPTSRRLGRHRSHMVSERLSRLYSSLGLLRMIKYFAY